MLVSYGCAGEERLYVSADSRIDAEGAAMYPTEFLNTMQPAGLPAHELRLKVGVPVMLLRNMGEPVFLMNNTRLVVTGLQHAL